MDDGKIGGRIGRRCQGHEQNARGYDHPGPGISDSVAQDEENGGEAEAHKQEGAFGSEKGDGEDALSQFFILENTSDAPMVNVMKLKAASVIGSVRATESRVVK